MAYYELPYYSRHNSTSSTSTSRSNSSNLYPQAHQNTCRQIFIKGLRDRTLVFQFELPPSPWELVERVANEVDLPVSRLSLFFRGRRINTMSTDLPNNVTLHATINAYSTSEADIDDENARVSWCEEREGAPFTWYDIDELSKQARYSRYLKAVWSKKRTNLDKSRDGVPLD